MTKISITLCAIIFSFLILGSECLKINHLKSDFKNRMNHKFSSLTLNHKEQFSVNFPQELQKFIMTSPDLKARQEAGEELTEDELALLSAFLADNEQFKQIVSAKTQEDACFDNLNPDQQTRFIQILTNQMSLQTIFQQGQNEPFQLDAEKLLDALSKDQDLTNALAQCEDMFGHHMKKAHKKAHKNSHLINLKKKMSHKFSKFTLNHKQQVPAEFAKELSEFVMSNPELRSKQEAGQQLTEDELAILYAFLLQNQQFQEFVHIGSNEDACFQSLTEDQKTRFTLILLDQMDLQSIFLHGQDQPFQLDAEKLLDALSKDQDLAEAMSKCEQITSDDLGHSDYLRKRH